MDVHLPARSSRFVRMALVVALAGCGSAGSGTADGGGDGPGDGAGDRESGDSDGPAAFTLGLAPPAVDCRPYAGLSECALRVQAPPFPPGRGDGLSWATAFADPQEAFDRATCGCEVWLEAGTYLPTRSLDLPDAQPDPRNRSFVLWPGIRVLGGFLGGEDDPAERILGHGQTTLSGDLGVPDVRDDNAYHVVVGADRAELDRLVIRDGEADGLEAGQLVGAGLFTFGANMTLRDVQLTDNDAGSGAGLYGDERSSPHLIGCTFARNTSNDGGGLVVLGDSAVVEHSFFEDNVGVFSGPAITDFAGTLTVTDTRFFRNRGDSGGAVTVSAGQATFDRCWFEGNQAGSFGGALLVRFGSAARLTSSVLVANGSVGFGGAIAAWTASVELEGATIVGNTAGFGGAFLVKDDSHFDVRDSVVFRSIDDVGRTFYIDGDASTFEVASSDLPPEVSSGTSFDADPRLANLPLATRFAVQQGATDSVPITGADQVFTSGDRIELGDDGLERRITAVSGIDVSFAPPLTVPAPRFLRVDLWPKDAPSLTLDLTPTSVSPLVDAASAQAPALDVAGHARVGAPDIGAIERVPAN